MMVIVGSAVPWMTGVVLVREGDAGLVPVKVGSSTLFSERECLLQSA